MLDSEEFNLGQAIGMMVLLTFIEKRGGIEEELRDKIMLKSAEQYAKGTDMAVEDVFLLVEKQVKEIL